MIGKVAQMTCGWFRSCPRAWVSNQSTSSVSHSAKIHPSTTSRHLTFQRCHKNNIFLKLMMNGIGAEHNDRQGSTDDVRMVPQLSMGFGIKLKNIIGISLSLNKPLNHATPPRVPTKPENNTFLENDADRHRTRAK